MPQHHPYGLLQLLPISSEPCQSISLHFITNLPDSKGFNAILTVVDQYTKMTHFVPGKETVGIVVHAVFRHHGLPNNIIIDRGP